VNTATRLRQICIIARLEVRRAFFSRRAFWVYFLALFPSVVFIGHGVTVMIQRQTWARRGLAPAAAVDSIKPGQTAEEVLAQTGKPVYDRRYREGRKKEAHERRFMMFFDGQRRVNVSFKDGKVTSKNAHALITLEEDRSAFAAVFQFYYLRLGIFFGCLGIFMNLFRGEMLSKTLHFWLLTPVRREVLLGGKYTAGLVAATLIFTLGTVLSFWAMLWPQEPSQVQVYLHTQAPAHAMWYAAATVLACVGYGSFFMAAGLLLRNPIVPAAVLLLWENIAGFLPTALQKLSVLHYVQALCPVPVPMDNEMPAILQLFFSPAAPPSKPLAILGVLALASLVLWAASRVVRTIQINYSTE
jgi:ABC-type transport system involved in multi-copper enzyme maturation permease subunit